MLSESIPAFIVTDTSLATALGIPRKDKFNGVFPTLAPDECQMPYIVFQQVTGDGSLDETYAGTGPLQTSRWRFSCYGTTYKNAKTLAKLLIRRMVSFNGPQTTGTCEIQGCWKRMEADDAEPIPRGTVYETHVDFEINYRDLDNT